MASIHETAEGLHAAGVMDKQTMRRFNEACLTPVQPLTAEEIRALREREGASQAVFARYLNVTTGLVSQWERGEKHPQGGRVPQVAGPRRPEWFGRGRLMRKAAMPPLCTIARSRAAPGAVPGQPRRPRAGTRVYGKDGTKV